MSKFKFELGERVIINHPKDLKYHGLVAEIEEIDHQHGLTYVVSVFDKNGVKMRNYLYLPERLLRRFAQKTLSELEPGDILVNRAGLEFVVVEPPSPVYYISPINSPAVTVHTSAMDLYSDGFKIKNRD